MAPPSTIIDYDETVVSQAIRRLRTHKIIYFDANSERIDDLTEVVRDLELELETRRELRAQRVFHLGETVQITNKYRGHQGTVGTVTKVTGARITLRDPTGVPHSRAPHNVAKVAGTLL